MMDLFRRNQEYRNFVSIYFGLAFVGEKLHGYTENKLDETFKAIYKKLAGKPPCHQQCSKVYKNKTARWCDTCSSWRTELIMTRTHHHSFAWSNMDSSNWPASYKNIAEVYLPSSWNIPDFQDVATACHIWTNLKACNINKWTIKRMKHVRNVHYAHNSKQSSTDLEKSKAFDVFRDLLNDADVNNCINSRECIDGLFMLKDANDKPLANIEIDIVEVNNRLKNIENYLVEERKWRITLILHRFCNHFLKWTARRISFNWRTFKKYFILMAFFAIVLLASLFPFGEIHQEECVSEDYNYPFDQDMPLLGYFSEHKALVGREWLFEEISVSIFKNSSDDRPKIVTFVAEMGYGKSALVAHMLCPNQNSQANTLRKHIVGFHICKFDVRSTHAPERFIRRIVGFLALRSAEYGHKISMLPKSSILYNVDECSRDYVACFDQGVTIPLWQIQEIRNAPWIIVIDALDECETSDQNDILQLLLSRSRHLPKFLKFLVTSRYKTSLTHARQLEIHYLMANDARNIKDITVYIQQHLSNSAFNSDRVNELVKYSDGNFVYVVQAVKWLIANINTDQIPKLPVDLEDVYEINFDRKYTNHESYTIPRMILEIVCSAANPIGKSYIFQILSKNNVTQNTTEFDKHFHSLSFFLNVDKRVRLAHQALLHWLVNETNLRYRISLERGHSLISQYLLSMTTTLGQMDLVDLVIHISRSHDSTLAELFQSSNFSNHIFEGKSLLHQLIWKTSAVYPLKLLLKHTHMLDGLNDGGVTPIFVAASKGHAAQLKLLHNMGADINFQVSSDFLISENSAEFKISAIKRVYHSGYTLLHIASQNGHTNIVKYLIKQNRNLVLVRNALGLQPGLVACENGFLKVIHEMLYMYPKSFGNKCLYYSSKNNHLHIVKWLVSKGVKFRCISDKLSSSAFKYITKAKRKDSFKVRWVMFRSDYFTPHLIHPLDKWWQVFKFDPLLAGIRHGSIQTAQYLIKTFPKSLKCSDVFGFTAALASVAFNRSDLLPFVASNLITDKCQSVPFYIRNSSLTFVQDMLSRNICPNGGGIAHVIAFYNLRNMFTYIVQRDLVKDWNEADNLGFLPVHYAAASYNIDVLMHYKHLGNLDVKAGDGSTIYHISAMNGFLAAIYRKDNNFLNRIPDLRDNNNKSILHYMVSYMFGARTASVEYSLHNALYGTGLFEHLIKNNRHDLMARNTLRRNILHYALNNGHFEIIHDLYSSKKSSVKNMLFQTDIFGDSPVAFALKTHTQDNYVLLEPYSINCFYFDIFYTKCITEWEQYGTFMSAWELSLLHVIKQMTKFEFKELLEPHLSHIWSKSVYLLVVLVKNHHQHLDIDLLRSLLIHHSDSKLMRYNQLVLARFVPSVFDYCTSDTMPIDSPLLYIVHNFDHSNTFFSLSHEYVTVIFDKIFRSRKQTDPFDCNDKLGYNIVYHAVKSGNIQTAKILIENGVKVTSLAIDVKGIFLAALTPRRRTNETNFHGCSPKHTSQSVCTDIFMTEVLKLNYKTLTAADFCVNGTSGLSPIHILSANGMLQTLKRLVEIFSSQILACYNKDKFTPLYLAQTFNQDAVVSFISSKTAIYLPDRYAEEYLIISLLHDFPLKNYSLCFKTQKYDRRQFGRWYYCASIIMRQLSLSKQYYLKKSSGILQHVWENLNSLVTCTDFFNYHARIKSLLECEHFVKLCFRCYGNIVRLQSSVREFFVLKTIGQIPVAANLRKLERLIELSMERLINVADNKFCTRYQKWKFETLHLSVYNTITYGQRVAKELVITYFLRLKKSDIANVPHEYDFLRSRMAVYWLPGSSTNVIPVPHNFILNTHNFYYLNILRKTLSYGELHDALGKYLTAVAVYEPQSQPVELERVKLEEPFADLH